ncbi:hypothetical protein CLV78_10239 [Aliiruegeria haliotis]|uniref:Phytol kinase n=1 Tax=Aliiruegeria haliotis TaxID=1280846 RepID=A0A2T0RUP5_9RHOB|nr:hypothetical protein [Aliiruegeria haliotis]PRY24867.1 hypothetical protein CLV78_10239 [Aliiruegeria haliotis]
MAVLGPVVMAALSIAVLLWVMAQVRRNAEVNGWSAEVQRKIIHVATGLYAICLPILFAEDWPVYLLLGLTVVAMAAMRLPALRSSGASAALHSVDRQSYGDFLLAAAVALVFLLSHRDPLLYVLPLAVLTLGDAAAALAGSAYGKRFFAVEDGHKSLEGSAVLFLVTVILSMTCLLLLSEIPRVNVVILAFLIATFSTLVEADSWRGFDNLFLPLAVLIILREHATGSTMDLAILFTTYLCALVLFHAAARQFGMTNHVARVYLAAIFLLLSVTATQNVVFCVLMLLLHLVAERKAPSASAHPELDAVTTLAVLSFGWLAAGNATGFNALDAFGACLAGVCMGLAMLAMSGESVRLRMAVFLGLGLAMPPLWIWLMGFNPPEKHWIPRAGWIMAANVGLVGLATLSRPAAFGRHRMTRIGALAVLAPAFAYATYAATFEGGLP